MDRYPYVIVGGGMAAAAAIGGIRERDAERPIGLLSDDRYPPYRRPPLSKGLWKGERLETVWWDPADWTGVTEHLGTRVVELDLRLKVVRDARGREWGFDKLLIATGGSPVTLPGAPTGVRYLRTLDDYLALWRDAQQRETFFVVGGGFIGVELAAALNLQGKRVTIAFPEHGLLGRVLPPELADSVTQYYREHGVEVLAGTSVEAVETTNGGYRVRLQGGAIRTAEVVVAGLGIRPNVTLAAGAGLHVDDGIVVDGRGATSHPDVFAAGDVARIPAPALGSGIRVEHEDNALTRGRLAGLNMAGADTASNELPFFYSDLFDLGFEAVGHLDPTLDTFADWVEPGREGVIYYRNDGRVVGVLNWNVWDGVPAARALIQSRQVYRPEDLRGRIANK
jgi:3-phenylpropionate/trans-cinnamate dioxygenase ferredoxin reductase subunit